MSKFSVKKPLTVLVAVVVVLVLGFVSFTRMTPDLLPNINLPYVIVATPYIGASPEKVEQEVTRPLEQAMATLDDIETVTSTSSENYSMVILEFSEDVNMDSITVDILQKINSLSGGWDDMVGTSTIMKLNPNMLPVMVAAVGVDGMDTAELSTFVNDTLMSKLEGVSGVASISASGLLEEEVRVVLSQQKIDALNEQVIAALDKQFLETSEELEEARDELEGQLNTIENGQSALDEGKDALVNGTAGISGELTQKQIELNAGKAEINSQITSLREQRAELLEYSNQMKTLQQAQQSRPQLVEQRSQLQQARDGIKQLQDGIKDIDNGMQAALNELLENAPAEYHEMIKEQFYASSEYKDAMQLRSSLQGKLDETILIMVGMGIANPTVEVLDDLLKELDGGIAQIDEGLKAAATMLETMGYSINNLSAAIADMEAGITQIDEGIVYLNGMLSSLESGEVTLKEAMAEVDRQTTSGILTIAETTTQMMVGQSTLTMYLSQIESGLEQLEDAKEAAYKQADLNNIITMSMVSNILTAQNFAMPAGYVTEDGVSMLVSVGDEISSLDELQNLLLFDMGMEGVDPVYLSDVAEVFIIDNADEIYANINGSSGVLLTFSKQSNYSTAGASDNLSAAFESLEEQYPGLKFTSLMDQGDYIYLVVSAVIENLLYGALLAVLVLLLFLRDLRPTFITLVSIPISVIFAFVLMYFSGVTLNMLSLAGLAVAVGMLVDNSVVVIENIYRLRAKGYSAVQAAVSGASQVAGAIAASTLTTICIFLPIVFVEGLTRQLFTDFALTFAYALIASLVIALTVVPSLSSRMLKKEQKQRSHKLMDKVLAGYSRLLKGALRFKIPVLAGVLALLVLSVVLAMSRGFSFMPSMDMGQLTVSVEMPEDNELADTMATADQVVERIGTVDGVDTVGAMLSGGGSSSGLGLTSMMGGSGDITMYVILDDNTKRSSEDIGNEILEKTEGLDCEVSVSSSSSMDISMLSGSGITLNLYGEDLDTMRETARELAALISTVEGTAEVSDGVEDVDPSLRITVDKNKAMEEGLTVAQVYMAISSALSTESTATSISYDGNNYDVIVDSGNESELTPAYIRNYILEVPGTDGETKEVALTDIATVHEAESFNSISRSEGRRYVTISIGIAADYNVSLVAGDVEKVVNGYTLPSGTSIEFEGENETIMESMRELVNMLLLGVVLVYLIMVAQFQSLKSPFIVMFTIPLAFTGGLLALFFTGFDISVISMIGFVMLVGIIVNNGIVLVDYINQLRADGVSTRDAIVEAGVTRMRPILMTSITTVFGLVTMAFGIGAGGDLMQPIAIVCIGGLVYATLLTLFVVPIMYEMFNRKELKVIRDEELEVVDD